jgi:hypothetical protein
VLCSRYWVSASSMLFCTASHSSCYLYDMPTRIPITCVGLRNKRDLGADSLSVLPVFIAKETNESMLFR